MQSSWSFSSVFVMILLHPLWRSLWEEKGHLGWILVHPKPSEARGSVVSPWWLQLSLVSLLYLLQRVNWVWVAWIIWFEEFLFEPLDWFVFRRQVVRGQGNTEWVPVLCSSTGRLGRAEFIHSWLIADCSTFGTTWEMFWRVFLLHEMKTILECLRFGSAGSLVMKSCVCTTGSWLIVNKSPFL